MAGLLILAIAVALMYSSVELPNGAALLPRAVLAIMMVLSVALIARSLRSQESDQASNFFANARRFSISSAAVALYIGAMPYLGFYTASVLFIPGCAMALGERRPLMLVATTVIFLGFVFLVFGVLLQRPLPPETFMEVFGELGAASPKVPGVKIG